MKVYALLSWWDEDPEHLTRCVTSLKGFADVLVALDGAYSTFPDAKAESPTPQQWALSHAVRTAGLSPCLSTPPQPWRSEVAKRAALFTLARRAGATRADWLLIIDGDMELAGFTSDARDQLAVAQEDTAEVRWHDMQIDGKPTSDYAFRSLFRALPELTVKRTHWLYVVPASDGQTHRYLWHSPSGHISPEPALDLTEHVTLHHYNSSRDPERNARALRYYQDRDAAGLEAVGDFT